MNEAERERQEIDNEIVAAVALVRGRRRSPPTVTPLGEALMALLDEPEGLEVPPHEMERERSI